MQLAVRMMQSRDQVVPTYVPLMTMHAGFVLREKLHGSLLPRKAAPLFGHTLRCIFTPALAQFSEALCHFPFLF